MRRNRLSVTVRAHGNAAPCSTNHGGGTRAEARGAAPNTDGPQWGQRAGFRAILGEVLHRDSHSDRRQLRCLASGRGTGLRRRHLLVGTGMIESGLAVQLVQECLSPTAAEKSAADLGRSPGETMVKRAFSIRDRRHRLSRRVRRRIGCRCGPLVEGWQGSARTSTACARPQPHMARMEWGDCASAAWNTQPEGQRESDWHSRIPSPRRDPQCRSPQYRSDL
ncbi:hypothetical protein SAMN04490220_8604 [Rhodococcus jostii]|uniref:Uncharacterized protein n=1 Tax=Rhodococcus jostii TaxID=132919 RepID=A0A1H5M259_RHOJO|nr:hypothetical protein SAMN04490220_8604 [Rhodococcus jostii]